MIDPKDPQLIAAMAADPEVRELAERLFEKMTRYRYSYNFSWLGRPVIQYPTDIVAMQELIWSVRPDLIVETGIAHGGSLIFYASMLELLGGGRVIGIDIDIRAHNRAAIEAHPLMKRITMIEGSSVDEAIAARVRELAAGARRVLVVLDSNHTHDHVLRELELYAPLVKEGSYVVVFDTIVEVLPDGLYPDRPWTRGNNPMTAVREFLAKNDRFALEREIEEKLLLTVAPGGYLRCIHD
jgi:cephalosporin hydroxylase